jgi:hypothetical protein
VVKNKETDTEMIELKESMHVVAEALKEGNDIMKNAITMSCLQF